MSKQSSYWLLFCVVFGSCLLALGAHLYLASPTGPVLEVTQTDFELVDCTADEKRDIVIRFSNNSSRALPVVGLAVC